MEHRTNDVIWTAGAIHDALRRVFSFWLEHGVDRKNGGFWNGVTIAGFQPSPPNQKSEFAQARQVYAYCLAAQMFPELRDELTLAAKSGVDFICKHFWQDDAGRKGENALAGGWIVATDEVGNWVQPLMPSYLKNSQINEPAHREIYEDAFILLSFAEYFRLSGDRSVMPWIDRTLNHFTDSQFFGRAVGGGFEEHANLDWTKLRSAPRTQNAHMHLFEALLTAHSVTGEERFAREAESIVELFLQKLFDSQCDCVGEFFEPNWQSDKAQGMNVEPGHSFEWVWLLHEYYKSCADERLPPVMSRLYDRAYTTGIDQEYGGVFDQIDRVSGAPVKTSKRLWPQVERTKADAAMMEFALLDGGRNRDAEAKLQDGLRYMFEKYAREDGCWSDNHLREGVIDPNETRINAPNVYHIVVALKEAARVLELLRIGGALS